jgi:hypothetical protein
MNCATHDRVESIAYALFRPAVFTTHGLDLAVWPRQVRQALVA